MHLICGRETGGHKNPHLVPHYEWLRYNRSALHWFIYRVVCFILPDFYSPNVLYENRAKPGFSPKSKTIKRNFFHTAGS